MNQIQFGNLGGMPVTQDDFNFLQSAVLDMFNAIAGAPGNGGYAGCILSGCTLSLQGGVYVCTPGYVYIASKKEIFYCPGGNTGSNSQPNLTWTIIDQSTAPDPVTFANQVNRNIHRVRTLLLANNPTGVTAYNSTPTYATLLAQLLSGGAWINVPLKPDWTGSARVRIDAFNNVMIEGSATAAFGAGATIFTLPSFKGLFPDIDIIFSGTYFTYNGSVACQYTLDPNGNFTVTDTTLVLTKQYVFKLPAYLATH